MNKFEQNTDSNPTDEFPQIEGLIVQSVLGVGGMGIVYRALNTKLDRIVALKMVHTVGDSAVDIAHRFLNEVQSISALQHTNIVQVLSAGEYLGHPYFVMEFIEGQSLEGLCKSQPQDPVFAAQLVKTLAVTMQHCHERNILHRDLKPSNVMMVDGRHPKITDFGLAKFLGAGQQSTRTGEIVGTPGYMAPEQAGGVTKSMGVECDVYGLGTILYKLLTGRPPFEGPEPVQVVMMLLTDDPVPPSRLQSRVPRDLETICLKCLAKQPTRRYRTASALAQDLDRFLNHQTINARPSGPIEKATKWIVRHPTFATSVVSIIFLVVSGLMGLWWHNHLLNDSIDKTRKLVEYSGNLSSWIVFEHLSQLRKLSGSTKLQLELVSKIQTYLDDSAREAEPNSVFLRQMGAAYECVADVQGNPYIPNLGRATESVANYLRAHELYSQSLLLDSSDLVTHGKVAECSIKLAEVTLQTEGIKESKKWLDEAANIIRRLSEAKFPKAVGLETLLVGSRFSIAIAENKPNEALKLLEQFDEIIVKAPGWASTEHGIAQRLSLASKRGKTLMELDRYDEARVVLERSMTDVIALSKENPNDFYFQDSLASKRLDLADCLTWLASVRVSEGLTDKANVLNEQALELYRETLGFRQRISKSDPNNAFAKYGLAVVWERIASVLRALQRHSETLEPAQRSLRLREELLALEPNNSDNQRGMFIITQFIGDIYWQAQNNDAAKIAYEKSLRTAESLVSSDNPSIADLEGLA
jgi:serine/threonine protein kinase